MPRHRYNEARSFIESGLQDVSLSRSTFTWGVPVPWDPDHVFYVWFDALLNYYTALSYAKPGEDLTDRFWPAQYHIIGKDILKFHTVFWPAMLLAAGLPLPEHVFVHGFLLMASQKLADDEAPELVKMSKSMGNVLDPFAIIDEFGTDALRFYCMRDVRFGQDGEVSTERFAVLYESELANDFGNLASRTIAMVHRYRDGTVPAAEPDPELAAEIDAVVAEVSELLDRADLTGALDAIWQRVRRLNRYVEEQAPWVLARDDERARRPRPRARLADRGPARRRRRAASVDPRDASEQAARHARRARARARRRAHAGRPARRDRQARAAVSQAAARSGRLDARRVGSDDRQPHAPARLQARRRRARRGGGRRRASRGC